MLTVKLERLALEPGARVLDLGCGEGRHVHGVHLIDGVEVVGLDLDEASLGKALEGLAELDLPTTGCLFIRGDAYRLPFADRTFDAVICSEVLEHLHDYHAVLAEIARVLKPHGRFAASVPRGWPERLCWRFAPGKDGYANQPGGHVRIFAADTLRKAITGSGFAYRGGHFAHALHSPYWWLKTLFWSRRNDHPLVRLYHRLLVWDIVDRPWLTRALEAALNPIMGKSLVLYFEREAL